MKTIALDYLRKRIKSTHPRTRKAQLNTLLGLVVKGGGMLISLLLVPMTIDYLSKGTYGTWLTISSIVTMLAFFDIGVGNGLRNKFSEAVANQDTILARAYVSTAYSIFGSIQLILVGIFALVYTYIPWQRIFNTEIDTSQLEVVVLLTVVCMAVKLVLDILSYVLFAIQESSRVGLITFFSSLLTLISTYTLTRLTSGNITYLALITAISPIAVTFISGIILYRNKLKLYRPTFQLVNFKHAGSLLSLGYKFFFIQIAVIIIFYTDNLIITQLFGPVEVTVYNVAFRYFNAMNTLFGVAIGPYWSAFTEASIKNDVAWMQRTYSYLQKLWLGLTVAVVVMVLVANPIYMLWVGDRVRIPYMLNICMGLFIIVCCWNNITVAVANGLGRVKLQLYYSTISAVMNIPLAILFGKFFDMGSAGVVLATCVSLSIGSVIGGLQAKKLISGTAKGIWSN